MKPIREAENLLYALPIIILVLGAFLGVSLWAITSSDSKEQDKNGQEVLIERGALPPLGNPDAPVQIVEFGDYQCPYCTKFFNETEQRLRAEYVAKGKVAFWWRDFAVLGEDSQRAARAARCANEQNAFWRYHDALFAARLSAGQAGTLDSSVRFTDETLVMFAERVGIEKGLFATCLSSDKYEADIVRDQQDGRAQGVQGVPT